MIAFQVYAKLTVDNCLVWWNSSAFVVTIESQPSIWFVYDVPNGKKTDVSQSMNTFADT